MADINKVRYLNSFSYCNAYAQSARICMRACSQFVLDRIKHAEGLDDSHAGAKLQLLFLLTQ